MEYKAGMKIKACVPFFGYKRTIHIDHIVPSLYEGRKLIIYRVWGKHKQWWHEIMCYDDQMDHYIEIAK